MLLARRTSCLPFCFLVAWFSGLALFSGLRFLLGVVERVSEPGCRSTFLRVIPVPGACRRLRSLSTSISGSSPYVRGCLEPFWVFLMTFGPSPYIRGGPCTRESLALLAGSSPFFRVCAGGRSCLTMDTGASPCFQGLRVSWLLRAIPVWFGPVGPGWLEYRSRRRCRLRVHPRSSGAIGDCSKELQCIDGPSPFVRGRSWMYRPRTSSAWGHPRASGAVEYWVASISCIVGPPPCIRGYPCSPGSAVPVTLRPGSFIRLTAFPVFLPMVGRP